MSTRQSILKYSFIFTVFIFMALGCDKNPAKPDYQQEVNIYGFLCGNEYLNTDHAIMITYTLPIDEDRHNEAVANFKAAGLSEYIDARLADAHQLVKELKGPFDFVFSDADKDWYTQYFIDVDPKLTVGGCFTAHNVRAHGMWSRGGTSEFYKHVKSLPNYETTVDNSGGGLSTSYKKSHN